MSGGGERCATTACFLHESHKREACLAEGKRDRETESDPETLRHKNFYFTSCFISLKKKTAFTSPPPLPDRSEKPDVLVRLIVSSSVSVCAQHRRPPSFPPPPLLFIFSRSPLSFSVKLPLSVSPKKTTTGGCLDDEAVSDAVKEARKRGPPVCAFRKHASATSSFIPPAPPRWRSKYLRKRGLTIIFWPLI